ncbi:putative stress up-regulated Nod 19, partial [Tanacetum coccineum]
CNFYNVTADKYGRPLKPNYVGGSFCCYDGTQCKVKNGIQSVERNLYLKYTVKWVDWGDTIIPVKIFIFDVTDTWQKTGTHDCLIDFDVEQSSSGVANNDCISTIRSSVSFPTIGDVVYGVAHQHSGGIGFALYGENHQESNIHIVLLGVALFGLAVSATVIIAYERRKQSENGYQFIST